MNLNKKAGIIQRGMAIVSIVLTLFAGIFLFIFYDQAIDQYLIGTLDDVSHNMVNDLGLSNQTNNTLNSLKTAYDDRPISYDIFFILLLLIALVTTSYSAIQANRFGYLTMFGYIFIISMFFLVSMSFVNQLTDYLIQDFMLPLFNDVTLDIPIMLHFFENLSIYAFLWFLWLGMLGFLDFKGFVKGAQDKVEDITSIGGFKR